MHEDRAVFLIERRGLSFLYLQSPLFAREYLFLSETATS